MLWWVMLARPCPMNTFASLAQWITCFSEMVRFYGRFCKCQPKMVSFAVKKPYFCKN